MGSLHPILPENIETLDITRAQIATAATNALSHEKTIRLTKELQVANDELEATNLEIAIKADEIKMTNEDLIKKNEELKTQSEWDFVSEMEKIDDSFGNRQTLPSILYFARIFHYIDNKEMYIRYQM